MKIVAFVPIKLNNIRLPRKNLKKLGGKSLVTRICETLQKTPEIEATYVFCSDPLIREHLSENANFVQREAWLDSDEANGNDICRAFAKTIPADIYVLAHATSPFINSESVSKGIAAVMSNEYASAFSVLRESTYAFYKGKQLNFTEPAGRTQDLEPVFLITSGFFVFKHELAQPGRYIRENPKLIEVSRIEAIDIDEQRDFDLAEAIVQGRYI